jgi:hypothetical protein
MARTVNTTNFADFVANSTINFRKGYDEFPRAASQLYDVENTSMLTGEESSLDGFSVAKIKREGEDFAYLDINQGDNKVWNVYEIGGMTKITWKMRVGNKYREMNARISNLGRSAAKRMEMDLTHPFTFGDSGSYTNMDGDTITLTTADGEYLFDTDHSVNGSSTTFRNIVANNPALSKGGVEAAEKLFATQMLDANGETVFEDPTHLVTTNDPNTVNTALEYLRSVSAPDAGVAGVDNVYKGKYTLIVLPYLSTTAAGVYDSTKAKRWMLVNLNHKESVLKVLEAPTFIPPTENDGKEFETMDWKFACHAAYALAHVRATDKVVSKGDASA